MRVLAVGAHPDDLEMLCGGTLARFVQEGHDVTMCHAARGDRGSYLTTMDEIARIRFGEAEAAATVLGATHRVVGLSDAEVSASDPEQRRSMVDMIRSVCPDLIITHGPDDYMPDHVETGRLVENASFIATVPLYETEHPATESVPPLLYMETLAGVGFIPTEYVDISDVIELKLEALACHHSQVDWLREHDGADTLGNTRVGNAYRGQQSGVGYAEGFRSSQRYLRQRTYRLLP